MADSLESAFRDVCKVFGILDLNKFQKDAIKCINEKRDVFVNVPTGFEKSIIFQALPLIFRSREHGVDQGQNLCGQDSQPAKPIVLVVSALNSLMKDQVTRPHFLEVSAIALNDMTSDTIEKKVVNGYYSVVYGSPELWLGDERWRKMVAGSVYRKNVKAVAVDEAHIVSQWYVLYFSKYN